MKRRHWKQTSGQGPARDQARRRKARVAPAAAADLREQVATPTRQNQKPKLTKNQQTMFSLLHGAGAAGLTTEEWNQKALTVDIGTKRKADLYDIRESPKSQGLVRQYGDRWDVC